MESVLKRVNNARSVDTGGLEQPDLGGAEIGEGEEGGG